MDLDYLSHRQQLSVIAARTATCTATRRAHLGLAQGYADRIWLAERARTDVSRLETVA